MDANIDGNILSFLVWKGLQSSYWMLNHVCVCSHLQWTEMGPSWPNCSLVLCTWPIKSMNPSPDLGTPCSGQSVNWNCRTVLDWPSCERENKQTQLHKVVKSSFIRFFYSDNPESVNCWLHPDRRWQAQQIREKLRQTSTLRSEPAPHPSAFCRPFFGWNNSGLREIDGASAVTSVVSWRRC